VTDNICGGLFLFRRDQRLRIGKCCSPKKMAPSSNQYEWNFL